MLGLRIEQLYFTQVAVADIPPCDKSYALLCVTSLIIDLIYVLFQVTLYRSELVNNDNYHQPHTDVYIT